MSIFDGLFGSADYGAQGLTATQAQLLNAQNQFGQQAQSELARKQSAYNSAMQQQMAMQGIQAGPQAPVKKFDPNEDPAFQMPFSNLVPLWQAKFGDKWINRYQFDFPKTADDEFYTGVFHRLERQNMFEKAGDWVRLKEV